MLGQPRVDSLHATPLWPNELLDLFLQKVLPIPCVLRVADLVQLALELGETRLRQRDAKRDEPHRRRTTEVDPIEWRRDGIF